MPTPKLDVKRSDGEPLALEINTNHVDETPVFGTPVAVMVMTPPIGKDYWLFRVEVSKRQAIVDFEKFGTVGIGFQHESDWNTNLPYSCPAQYIFNHISKNLGDDSVSEESCLAAIQMIREAAALHMKQDLAIMERRHSD